MRRKVICWSIAFLTCCCLAYGDTPGWDPDGAPSAYVGLETSPGYCYYDWINGATALTGVDVKFCAHAIDIDNQGDPIAEDGVHCTWFSKPAGGDWVEIGKSRGNSYCVCAGYGTDTLTYSFRFPGDYEVKCVLDDCHIWADDTTSPEYILEIHVDYNTAACIHFTYDENGNRDSMTDPHGQTSYDWDRLHRLTKVTEPDTKWISYEYDWNNNRTKMTDRIETTSKDTVYEYNTRGLLWKLTDRNGGTPTTYTYNDDGSLATMTYPNGVVATYAYDPYRGWLTHLIHESGATTIAEFTYAYNPTYWGKNGTRTSMAEYIRKPDGSYIDSTVSYTYDDLYRLTGEVRTGDYLYNKSYTYDRNGNRETMTYGTTTYYHYDYASKLGDYGSVDTPGSPSNTRLTYDGAGNTEFICPPGSGPVTTYTWDWNNKLTKVQEGTTTIAQFAYDGDGTRTSATFDSGTTRFLYSDGKLTAELDGQGNLAAFYTGGPDGTISRLLPSGGPMYYHGDGLASVKAATGGTPVAVTDTYSYDAWGNRLVHLGSAEQPYQFVGGLGYYVHYQESDIRLLQLGARYYDASLGRFTARDPIGYQAGMNLYSYVNDRPSAFVDPDGYKPLTEATVGPGRVCVDSSCYNNRCFPGGMENIPDWGLPGVPLPGPPAPKRIGSIGLPAVECADSDGMHIPGPVKEDRGRGFVDSPGGNLQVHDGWTCLVLCGSRGILVVCFPRWTPVAFWPPEWR